MTDMIEAGICEYSQWRLELFQRMQLWRRWLTDRDLYDSLAEMRVRQILDALRDDRLYVAFVAEFSRGKSELINALFFSGFGQRVLPSRAGRTTMCPTEILYRRNTPPSISLLPIETRAGGASVADCKKQPGEWVVLPMDRHDPQHTARALNAVTETLQVTRQQALDLGLDPGDQPGAEAGESDTIEIPRWRHAVINLPHPLLERGLVILDTPGLNALGAEPELTLNLLASAHATLFILAADTGVTRTDLTVWREHIRKNSLSRQANLVVLNKIDSLWDELRTPQELESELASQVQATAVSLGIPARQIYPVSAQKALLARIHGDQELLQRSRIEEIEQALSSQLMPARQAIVRDNIAGFIDELRDTAASALQERIRALETDLERLQASGGKNTLVVASMEEKIHREQLDFEHCQQQFSAIRKTFTELSNELYTHLTLADINRLARQTRREMSLSPTTRGIRLAMAGFFQASRDAMQRSAADVQNIREFMDGAYREFSREHGLKKLRPRSFSTEKYLREINDLETSHVNMMGGSKLYLTGQVVLANQFYRSAVAGVREVFVKANRDADNWLRTILAPVESQVQERKNLLKRRLDNNDHIRMASQTLHMRTTALREQLAATRNQLVELEQIASGIRERLWINEKDLPRLDKVVVASTAHGSES